MDVGVHKTDLLTSCHFEIFQTGYTQEMSKIDVVSEFCAAVFTDLRNTTNASVTS